MKIDIRFLKKLFLFITVVFLIQASTMVLAASYKMTGILTAVNLSASVAVIEVGKKGNSFTVAGPLSNDARLTKSGHPAQLEDFTIGSPIEVEWHHTADGHVIDRLVQ